MSKSLIYIVYGASGAGKTTLLNKQLIKDGDITIHTKGVTRVRKDYDKDEVKIISEDEISKYDYVYPNYGHFYCIEKKQIIESIENHKSHFIICNDKETIIKIKNDFPDIVRVMFLLHDQFEKTLVDINKQRGVDDEEIAIRLLKYKNLMQEFMNDRSFYNFIILNKFSDNHLSMYEQTRAIIDRESGKNKEEYESLSNKLKQMEAKFEAILQTLPSYDPAKPIYEKDFVFITMQSDTNNSFNIETLEAIKRTCVILGKNAQRIDDTYHIGVPITQKIFNHIVLSELIIADLTDNRPNVYYEIGYAHALKKKVVLICNKKTTPHFDLVHNQIIFFEGVTELEEKLNKVISDLLLQ